MPRHFLYITVAVLAFSISVFTVSNIFWNTEETFVTVQKSEEIKSESVKSISTRLPLLSNPKLIIAGESVGLLRLGDSRERMLELFPKKPNYDFAHNYEDGYCGQSDYHWLTPDFKSNGLFFYLKQERIYQISVETDLFSTKEGIKESSSPQEVKRHFPNANKAYVYLNSGSKVVGGRNLIYWIDNKSGIAFEFNYNPKKQRREVKAVTVFVPNTDFQPDGCFSRETREFVEIESFTVEPSEKLQKDFDQRHGIER